MSRSNSAGAAITEQLPGKTKQFADTAKIAEQIEALERQINDLLQGKEITFRPESSPKGSPTRGVLPLRKVVTSAPVANKEERGTLRPAVVRILKRSKSLSGRPISTTRLWPKGIRLLSKSRRKSSEFDFIRC
jgi:hypothetical protein